MNFKLFIINKNVSEKSTVPVDARSFFALAGDLVKRSTVSFSTTSEVLTPHALLCSGFRNVNKNKRQWDRDRDQCSHRHKRPRCRYSQQFSTL